MSDFALEGLEEELFLGVIGVWVLWRVLVLIAAFSREPYSQCSAKRVVTVLLQ